LASIRASYLLCVLDDYSRLALAEVMEDITALTTMFADLRCMQALKREFGIQPFYTYSITNAVNILLF
jgi:hypothetical protein